jgi:hypothetical protein
MLYQYQQFLLFTFFSKAPEKIATKLTGRNNSEIWKEIYSPLLYGISLGSFLFW